MIGVICTCAPSSSKMLQEHLPSFETLKSRLQTSFRTTGHFISKVSTKSSSSGYERRGSNNHQSGDHLSYKERLTGGKTAGDRGYEMHDGNAFQTFVGEGTGRFTPTKDGIHLKSEILQERTVGDGLYGGDGRKWESVMAFREADMV